MVLGKYLCDNLNSYSIIASDHFSCDPKYDLLNSLDRIINELKEEFESILNKEFL